MLLHENITLAIAGSTTMRPRNKLQQSRTAKFHFVHCHVGTSESSPIKITHLKIFVLQLSFRFHRYKYVRKVSYPSGDSDTVPQWESSDLDCFSLESALLVALRCHRLRRIWLIANVRGREREEKKSIRHQLSTLK